ncbi:MULTISPECIES: hypothetical protein [Tenacibaculum]|uniref:Uncharacterized protein n=2 Tax=Tenacibaculum TaxID=104267 RepID=A0AAE9SGT0_9FLAO|nr:MULTISPECIES: hypothetical protein [Tenacibaculum]GFD78600.1 hypothetical protein KUL118_14620 [Tenacibaculum sp. KUL118]GFD99226.1 hypothetical protein KUL156_18190 [Alteromonas sp. KUL156]AZJ33146.1 hypothetical protein D6200_11510 [Tenacibaculum mesophilum]KAF9659387.1 hypothetical protein HBA12_03840 [Tenacibaculum mesophilum]MCG7500627.1 hypothetical protein [Tenacibaculum sp. Mcav3-52]
MPANSKYLNQSPWQQFAKISAGLIGGYVISALLHMCLVLWLPNPKGILITSIYTIFIVWGALLIVPYLFKNGWKAWVIYLIISIILYVIYYLGNQQNPFI